MIHRWACKSCTFKSLASSFIQVRLPEVVIRPPLMSPLHYCTIRQRIFSLTSLLCCWYPYDGTHYLYTSFFICILISQTRCVLQSGACSPHVPIHSCHWIRHTLSRCKPRTPERPTDRRCSVTVKYDKYYLSLILYRRPKVHVVNVVDISKEHLHPESANGPLSPSRNTMHAYFEGVNDYLCDCLVNGFIFLPTSCVGLVHWAVEYITDYPISMQKRVFSRYFNMFCSTLVARNSQLKLWLSLPGHARGLYGMEGAQRIIKGLECRM